MFKQLFIAALLALGVSLPAAGQQIPPQPNPPRLVNDFAGLLSQRQAVALEDSLASYARRTGTQVVVVTVASFDGTDAADYAQKLGEAWGVGQKEHNNGAVILVKPKTADERGRAFIATGYGLEGALPDITCSRIVNDKMIPCFRTGDYASGIIVGAISVMQAAEGEYMADPDEEPTGALAIFGGIILFGLILFFAAAASAGKSKGSHVSGSTLLDIMMLGSMLSGSRKSSGWDSFSSGSGSFGGFGGFGGGSFGGGGGGGSW